MLRKLWHAMRPAILWSYKRGSWQYDLIVAGILAFIFLTPRDLFRDQPRPPSVQRIEALGDDRGTIVFWVEPSVIDAAPKAEATERVTELLRQRTGRNLRVIETRPTEDAEGAVRAYLVYARP
jgi:hypothetical protein